jgi:DNA uptake protein ComE-like DNA-binding protein
METPSWRYILGGTAGVALLGAIGYFGQARIRTDSDPQKFASVASKAAKKPAKSGSKSPESKLPIDSQLGNPVSAPPPDVKVMVDITGEIVKPGVYEVKEGMRVEELVKLAGGLKPNADRNKVNFAQKLKDEAKIVVPAKTIPRASVSSTRVKKEVSATRRARKQPDSEPESTSEPGSRRPKGFGPDPTPYPGHEKS